MKSLLLFALFASEMTFASTTDVWEGSGILFNEKVEQIGSYTLVVESTKINKQIQSRVTVSLPDGKIIKQKCIMTITHSGKYGRIFEYDSFCKFIGVFGRYDDLVLSNN